MTEVEIITTHLQKLEIEFEIEKLETPISRNTVANCNPQIIFSVLMTRARTPFMMIMPIHQIIDPISLSLKFSTKIEPIDNFAFGNLPRASQFGYPPLPKLYNLEVVAERSLLEHEQLAFILENGRVLVKLSRESLQKMMPKAKWEDFGIDLLQFGNNDFPPEGTIPTSPLGLPRYTPAALEKRLHDRHEFPVMSSTAQKILKMQANPYAEVEDLARLVSESPTLAAQVIKWSNSPYYGFPGHIKTINDAIIKVLGFDMVLNMALGLALGDKFKIALEGPIGLTKYWESSLCAASVMEMFIKKMPSNKRPSPGLAYLCGLLHNFGFLLLGECFPRHFALVNQLIPVNPHLSIVQIEQCTLGVSHVSLGSWLMNAWHMPEELIFVTAYHHTDLTELTNHQTYVGLCSIALTLLSQFGIGDSISHDVREFDLQTLGLDLEHYQEISQEVAEKLEDLRKIANQLVHT